MSKTLHILVVDDDHSMAKTLVDILCVKGYKAHIAYSSSQALEKMAEIDFDCVLSDIKMPETNGIELYRAIKAQQSDLPVVLMTAYSSDSLVKEGLQEGAIAALTKPLDIELVLAFFSFLSKERSVAVVDDDAEFAAMLDSVLQKHSYTTTVITDPFDVLDGIESGVQVVLLDIKLNGKNGLDVLREIREWHPHLPVILVTGYGEEMSQLVATALEIGAYACLYKPLEMEALFELLTRVYHQELGRVLKRF